MHLNCFDVAVCDDDLNSVISKHVPATGKISNIHAALKNDHLIFTGRVKIVFPVNFEASFALSFTEKEIIARLAGIRPMSGLMDQFKNKILEKISGFAPFIRLDAERESIRIPVNDILRHVGLVSNLSINDLTIAENLLTLKVRGAVNFSTKNSTNFTN